MHTLTGVRLHPPGRTDKHLCRCFGAPATHARRPHGRVFPDHLITRGTRDRLTPAPCVKRTPPFQAVPPALDLWTGVPTPRQGERQEHLLP
jgi:hypothetical protein